jgi:uncharacterized membrane protein YidH (DUF202 family)
MINTTFGFLMVFVALTVFLHFLLLPRIKTKRAAMSTQWLALVMIGLGLIIAVSEMRSLGERRRFQDLDTFMQSRSNNARGRAEDMIAVCRRLVEMNGGTSSPSSKEFQEALLWAEAAASDLRPRYETLNWLRFLQKNSSVRPNEDQVIQQLKLPILSLLMEMETVNRNQVDHAKEMKRRGQLLWLAPHSPWLLIVGVALLLTKATSDWRMESGG